MDNKLSIKKYFEKGNFIIPNYQRGYKWGVSDEKGICAVSILLEDLIAAFEKKIPEYFLEAVTVVEKNGKVIIVDGQQRTTTLYLLFVALELESKISNLVLDYEVRKDSDDYLKKLKFTKDLPVNEDIQDIYFFNIAITKIKEIIRNKPNFNVIDFGEYILDKVHMLYNVIDETKAITTFISLNGLKAIMKDEELIKSDLLIKSSRNIEFEEIKIDEKCEEDSCLINKTIEIIEERNGLEWKINEDRGRLARNWDKWLYWWNQKEVKDYFGTSNEHPLYYLLRTYWNQKEGRENEIKFDFDTFKKDFIENNVCAKNTFEGLRKLQKSFEDLYNNFETYNYLGIVLKTNSVDKELAIQYFMKIKESDKLKEYAIFRLVNSTHLETTKNTIEKYEDNLEQQIKIRKASDAIELISQKYVYWDEEEQEFKDGRKEFAFRFLLLLNVLEDNKLNRKFDFSICNKRSLEHIHPKSKNGNLSFNENTSVHCIGNLVLLYGNDNSSFGAKDFDQKKIVYFSTSENELKFKSRNLLHSLSVFSSSGWGTEGIEKNQEKIVNNLIEIYGIRK